ncbi:MAG: hypothetical protein A3F83_06665 [Candidatus Glassbacteria bacterium RIFCSPLOWO2_12_FULL_58_11]|uniref:M23ase beta-sheet core domain-containing protein n=1 Tax=Candidatus Glassbacteria bacterium RIFCSPLOWO2_12_FULL_58_11 TaxID=1817867 RepID=A0A1F5YRN6_9BACT|nr:MAG: hypothetical protein A3F83_06665 [Candidatus Glassbacteria bacterium RIFCSPLOWO2_12_FULL_58_11]
MPFKDLTVLVVPHNEIQVHRFKISRWLLVSGSVVCLAFISCLGYLILTSYNKNFDYLKYINLQRENRILTQKLEGVENNIAEMNTKVGELMEENQVFRRIAGLEVLDEQVKEVGIGGTFVGNYDELFEINGPLAKKIYKQEDQIDVLLRKSKLIDQSLQEAIQSLEASSDKWTHTPSIMPTKGYISSFFGRRSHPIYHVMQPHNGIDISCGAGAPIIAPADGIVTVVKNQIGYGLTEVVDHGYGYTTRYAHMSKSNVRVGQKVSRGDVIGFVGHSGITTGPNLHYEVYVDEVPKDPMNFILDNYVP